MCNWKKWIWPGILATVLLTALAMLMKSGSIEQDLQAKALNDLSGNHQWAQVELDGRDLTLTGVAPSEDAATEALQLADDAYDVRVAKSMTTLLPIADPYKVSAVKADNKIVLDGNVPSDAVRGEVNEAAKAAYPGAEVVDNMTLARGAPEGFAALAGFGISQLTGLDTGTASLDGLGLSVTGEAKDVAAYDAVKAALAGDLPGGGKIVGEEIISPAITPYPFAATKSDSGITLTGYVPDEAARAAVVAAAGEVTSGSVTDNLEIGAGEPAGFGSLAGFGIKQLGEFSTGSASLTDAKLAVVGTALTPEAYDNATNALAGAIPSEGVVTVADITRSTVSPFTFSASKDKGILVLDGYVTSSDEKTNAVSFATETNPGDRIIDRLVVANGAPDGINWGEANQLAIKEASQFSKGTATLSDTSYSLDGMAMSNDAYDMLTGDGGLPDGVKLASETIQRPIISPYVWSFTNMEGAAPTLQGYVPADDLSAANIEQVESKVGTARSVESALEVGAGAPANLAAATSVGIQAASRLVNGKAEITDTQLMVTGEALSEAAASEIRARVENGVPPGFSGKHDISVRKVEVLASVTADDCQALLTKELQGNVVQFESAKSVIKEDSFGLLDRLAFAAKSCPTQTIAIEGHTDSDGSDASNQTLSEARANAVRSYLVNTGIFVGRLQAVGFGEKQPVADNSTPEGKSKNRRIEFKVIR
ncbi:MAG: OmpA family protein [Salaquimonas sp.]